MYASGTVISLISGSGFCVVEDVLGICTGIASDQSIISVFSVSSVTARAGSLSSSSTCMRWIEWSGYPPY